MFKLIVGGALLVLSTLAHATAPTVNYSYYNTGPGAGGAVGGGTGYSTYAAVTAAVCSTSTTGIPAYFSGFTTPTLGTCNIGTESTPGVGIVGSVTRGVTCSPPISQCSTYPTWTWTISKTETCPEGEVAYSPGGGVSSCRPVYCAANANKYFSTDIALGVVATGTPSPPAPEVICHNACEGNLIEASKYGIDNAAGTQITWSAAGRYRYSGKACTDLTGSPPPSVSTVTDISTTRGGPGSSALSSGESAVLTDIKINTAAISTGTGAVKTATDAVKTSTDAVKTAVDAVKTAVDGVKDAISLTEGEGNDAQGLAYGAMDNADADRDFLTDQLTSGNLPGFGNSATRWKWLPDSFFPASGAKCKIDATWHFAVGATVIGDFNIGPDYCEYAPWIQGFLYFLMAGMTFTYLLTLVYRK